MEINKQELQAIYLEQENITHSAKMYAEKHGIEFTDSFRRKCSKYLNNMGVVSNDLDNETVTDNNQYKPPLSGMPSAWWAEKNRFYTIEEFCDVYGLDKNSVKSSKLVSHNASHMTYNIAFFNEEEEAILDVDKHLDEVIQKYIEPIISNVAGEYVTNSDYFDRLVYTDVHISMNVNGKDGDSLYEGKWDREEVLKRLDLMLYHVHTFKKSRKLIIDDLGDFLDGLGGQTTRKGHELPQNMNDKEAFELALEFKIKLIDNLVNEYEEIICHNITNDNHSGIFSYFVSSAFEKIINCRYSGKVKVKTIKKFIDHYSEGKHTFLISHGKDMGEQKFGLKPKLDAIQAEKIDQYCKENKLYNGNFIEFSKGDSHQAIYDDTTSNDFSYYNYPAFSPPSNWVKVNFKNSKSGFNFFNIKKDEDIKISIPYWF
ncbi:MAG: hypothetical protein ACRCX2_21195 [Paraclostridium sp.]